MRKSTLTLDWRRCARCGRRFMWRHPKYGNQFFKPGCMCHDMVVVLGKRRRA